MILFFRTKDLVIIAVQSEKKPGPGDIGKLKWLFGNAELMTEDRIAGSYVGPRKEMVTPWSTNAVEISQNMGIQGLQRIEEYFPVSGPEFHYDPMLQAYYDGLSQSVFFVDKKPEPVLFINDIAAYNEKEGLALSAEEIEYLENLSRRLKRQLTDSEVFGFSQVNSEHCRHKIFNGTFIIDGEEKKSSLFNLIRLTSKMNPNKIVSAYQDNCSFNEGPIVEQFAPASQDKADYFEVKDIKTVLSLKAETHNFPTTVEPFNGAATGTGGEIRDRIGGGKGALPLAGTAVYMTSYPRPEGGRDWEKNIPERKWLYQSPGDILIKASNGASDFGNKFGQPLICGSLLTFEHFENYKKFGFDKVIMLAGGVGYGKLKDSKKDVPAKDDAVILLGGDNYRIGMGGGAVSSVATGEYGNKIELNAVQRANPEMQKRVYNAIRAIAESDKNSIITVHDHGAGGHLNCLSELVEATGGEIDISKLPVGDPTLSAREIAGNESQERMGLVIKNSDVDELKRISERERAPFYKIGKITGDHRFRFINPAENVNPIDLDLTDFFGNPPKTVMTDKKLPSGFGEVQYSVSKITEYIEKVLQLESVACKDWLTNKVDRSVTGKVAKQQCAGELQLPLNNLGAVALDYRGKAGIATSIGHAPAAGLVDPAAGSVLAIAEALSNIIWAPLADGLKSISLSANWMWPCRNPGEDARLYDAVEAASRFAIETGLNIPTGKDSLSMTQKYNDEVVYSPGTVIISAAAEVSDIRKIVEPVLVKDTDTSLIYIDLSGDDFKLGGSSLAQVLNFVGKEAPVVKDSKNFVACFEAVQKLIHNGIILAGHDISAGGLLTTLLEMNFANSSYGAGIDISGFSEKDTAKVLFAENPGLVIQVKNKAQVAAIFDSAGVNYRILGAPHKGRSLNIRTSEGTLEFDIDSLRDLWFKTSWQLDRRQSGEEHAKKRFQNYGNQALSFNTKDFTGKLSRYGISPDRKPSGIKAAIIREKGVNGDREMAYMMYLAGLDVKDVHMTDLISGRENLEDLNMIVFVGGFSNSDVLGSAKGWAGAFKYNDKARTALENFYKRKDTLSLGVCNGCQLMIELGLIYPEHEKKAEMHFNASHKFESNFISVEIAKNSSVMMHSLSGMRLGVWVAHGEGRFQFPYSEDKYSIAIKYTQAEYPGNPNGSDFGTAGICSADGRHFAMMPHLERSFMPWQCAYYPSVRKDDEITPWVEAFVNAREWVKNHRK
ncbi:MAG: phosphoribosylformylglycinamidine synthase [Bacteroidales bacterium]|nr:phosphoribosylformylglycinamidine synthase [Bacteroidales bacterium]MCB9012936.1 phosphoribosylformylglycinamidine synthase [Bacteroidales bacterium]